MNDQKNEIRQDDTDATAVGIAEGDRDVIQGDVGLNGNGAGGPSASEPAAGDAETEVPDGFADTAEVGPEDGEDGAETELELLRAERDDLRERFMRALADAENARKRAMKERRDAELYGATRLARDLLTVYDSLKRAVDAASPEDDASSALLEGVELTLRELLNVLSRHGVEAISPKLGDRFDPKLHEAMFEAPVPETKAGEIIEVSAQGFTLHDRLLRAAQVGVSSTAG